jgi:outer membrane protein OmpA-like peptidoglycan-associated protein
MAGVFWRSYMNNRRILAVFSGIVLGAMASASVADAQRRYNLYSPGSSRPSVIVDLTVLDKLGPEQTLPNMLRPFTPLATGPATAALAPNRGGLLPPPKEPPKSKVTLPPELTRRSMANTRTRKQAAKQMLPAAPSITKPPQSKFIPPKQSLTPPRPAKPVVKRPAKLAAAPKPAAKPKRVMAPPPPKLMAPKLATPKVAAITPTKPRVIAPPKPIAPKVRAPIPPKPAAKMAPIPAPPAPKVAKQRPTPPKVTPPKLAAPRITKPSTVPPAPKLQKPNRPQVALAGPATGTGADGTLQIRFGLESSDLPSKAKPALDALVAKLKGDPNLRVQLHGYASGPTDSPSQARRLSLFRALSVRTHLMKSGVRSTRIDVRALGIKIDGGPKDRVDVLFPRS